MHLPPFVTADAVSEHLGWANSIKRQVSSAAAARNTAGWTTSPDKPFYENVVQLLGTPLGGRTLNELVLAADPDKKRSLTRAVLKAVAHKLGHVTVRHEDAADLVGQLLQAECPSLAGWLTFDVLSNSCKSEAGQGPTQALVALIEKDEELRAALGGYWPDWKGTLDEAPATVETGPEDGLLERWSSSLATLRTALDGALPFDGALVRSLRAGADELADLVDWHAAVRSRLAELAQVRIRELGRLHEAAASLPPGLEWAGGLLEAVGSNEAAHVEIEDLAEAAAWLEQAGEALRATEARYAGANARYKASDDDTAFDDLAAARNHRIEERRARKAQADALITRLRDKFQGGADVIWAEAELEPSPESLGTPPPIGPAKDPPADSDAGQADGDLTGLEAPRGPAQQTALPAVALPLVPAGEAAVIGSAAAVKEEASSGPEPSETAPPAFDVLLQAEVPLGIKPLRDDSPSDPTDPMVAVAETVVSQALRNGRYGLAAHVARAAEALGAPLAAVPGSAVLSALCVGEALDEVRRGPVEALYVNLLPHVLEAVEGTRDSSRQTALLALAGALRPALFSPHTGAAEVIRNADPGKLGRDLRRLADFIVVTLPKRGGAIDLAATAPAIDAAASKAELAQVRAKVLEVADAAPTRTALFARATYIWRELFQSGPVCRAVAALRHDAADAAARVNDAAGWLDTDLHSRVDALDEQARKPRDDAIVGKAREWLLVSLGDLAKRLRLWLAVHNRASAARSGHQHDTRSTLRDLLGAAADEVAGLAADPELEPACTACRRALDGAAALLDGWSRPALDALLDPGMLLHDDLLLFDPYPDQARKNAWLPAAARGFVAAAGAVAADLPDFAAAFERLVAQSRFDQAEQAAARLKEEGKAGDDLDVLVRDARLQALEAVRRDADRLRAQADDLLGADIENRIDPAVAVRLEALAATLRSLAEGDEVVSGRLDFVALQAELDLIGREIQDGADLLIQPLEQEVDRLEAAGVDVGHLRELARKRDLSSLRESLPGSRGASEADGLDEGRRALLLRFGRHFASQGFAGRPLQERSVGRAIEDARHGRSGPALDFSHLTEGDREDAVKLLQAWQALLAPKSGSSAVRDLLLEVRLTGVKIEREAPLTRARSYRVSLDRTTDRRDCPVPAFGSGANGKLNVLVAEAQSLDGGELHRLVRGFEDGSVVPVMVVVKGLMAAEQRVRFMREARKNASQNPCALLDEAAILCLATTQGRSRGDMFAVALPAGGVQPYSNASSKSSPEMFFGRSEELSKLWDQGGSCLVYGGRQLGKTALLQQVRVRYHRPPSQVVLYGSLQGQTDVWQLVARLLRQEKVPCARDTKAAVTEAIGAWLDHDTRRRLLILVDEADTFLSAEVREGYKSLIVVRDLMQEWERRCKFVFAGLHDVQRLARTPNSPLHHLGSPLGIGPLFGKDLGDARRMVTSPMAAAGVEFDGLSLPNRILSAVGFYPSLLQTFGDTLLRRLGRSADVRIKAAAPCRSWPPNRTSRARSKTIALNRTSAKSSG